MDIGEYQTLVHGLPSPELDMQRLRIIRQLGRLTEQLAVVNEERIARTPVIQEAVVLTLGERQ